MDSCDRTADGAEVRVSDATRRVETDRRSFALLMESMRRGSEDAAFEIVERYSPTLLRVIRKSLPRRIRDKVDSVDMLNTLLGALLTNRALFERVREPQEFVALLVTCAKNRVNDEARRYTRTARRDVDRERRGLEKYEDPVTERPTAIAGDGRLGGRELTPSVIAASREKWRTLLGSLSRRDRRVLMLRIRGRSYDKIADELEGAVSPSTAKRIIDRVQEYLRL